MAQDEDRLTESNSNIIADDEPRTAEVPTRPFAITVEFPFFMVMMGASLCGAPINNLILYRTCVHSLNHSVDECHIFISLNKNNQSKALEDEVQEYATTISTVSSIIEAVIPAFLTFVLGVWSDTHGRKPLLVWPLFGLTINSMMWVVYSMLENLGPWWSILNIIPYSLCGGFTIFFTGAYCYMSDVSSPENRSLRMTILESSVSAGSVVGSLLSAPILRLVGSVYLILIAATVNVAAYVFSNIWIRESLVGAVKGTVSSLLDIRLVKDMIRECFKQRPNHGRAQILLLTIANSISIFSLYGLLSLQYMYTREKLHWAIQEYTVYSASATTISFVGSFLGIGLLQRLLRIGDMWVANVAFVSVIAEYLIKAFAVSSWHMYLAASIAVFKGLSSPLIRSFLTKILPLEDIAKVFALMSAIEGICPLISPLLYNSLYKFTITTFPGAIYALTSAITLVCVVFIGVVQYFRRNVTSPYQQLTPAETL